VSSLHVTHAVSIPPGLFTVLELFWIAFWRRDLVSFENEKVHKMWRGKAAFGI
jgi:hypothetical protein